MSKLVVLEGIDGSGKSANFRRLCARLTEEKIPYHSIEFPRYDKESSALLRMYLNGAFGTKPEDVNAYTASTFFSVDRFASYREDWRKPYLQGKLILSDRYTTSNAVHQGAKLPPEELPEFFGWLADLEFEKMGLPRPDLVIDLPRSRYGTLSCPSPPAPQPGAFRGRHSRGGSKISGTVPGNGSKGKRILRLDDDCLPGRAGPGAGNR